MARGATFDAPERERAAMARSTAIGIGVVAITFLLARLLAAAVSRALAGDSSAFDPPGEVAAAILAGGTLALLAPSVTGGAWSRVGAVGTITFASVAAVMIEGSAFAPVLAPVERLPLGLVLQLGVSIAAATVAVTVMRAPAGTWAWPALSAVALVARLTACALVYVVAYFVTGALNYALVTGPYYATHAGGLVQPDIVVVLGVAVLEGFLLALGALPLARALGGSRWSRATTTGLVLWLLGGVVPLLQASTLPDVLRLASAVEIVFQKVPLGIAVVWLLAPRRAGGRVIAAGPLAGPAAPAPGLMESDPVPFGARR